MYNIKQIIKRLVAAIGEQMETNKTNVDDLYGEYIIRSVSFCLQCTTEMNGQHVK